MGVCAVVGAGGVVCGWVDIVLGGLREGSECWVKVRGKDNE